MLLTIFSSHGSGAVQFWDFHRKGVRTCKRLVNNLRLCSRWWNNGWKCPRFCLRTGYCRRRNRWLNHLDKRAAAGWKKKQREGCWNDRCAVGRIIAENDEKQLKIDGG